MRCVPPGAAVSRRLFDRPHSAAATAISGAGKRSRIWLIRVEYGPKMAMNCADGICSHWRAKNALSRSRFAACRGVKTASGHSKQTHGLAGQGLPGGPCSPDSGSAQAATNTSCSPLSSSVTAASSKSQPGRQAGIASRQVRGVLIGKDHWRLSQAEHAMLGVLNDRIERMTLRGGSRGQVVIALNGRRMVRVDQRPGAAVPAVSVAQRQVGRPDPPRLTLTPCSRPHASKVDCAVVVRQRAGPPSGSSSHKLPRSSAGACAPVRRRSAPATAPVGVPPGAGGSATPPRSAP